jgi:hypothetical protein
MKKQEVIEMLQNGTALLDVCSIPVTKVIELINQIEVIESSSLFVNPEKEQVVQVQEDEVKISRKIMEDFLEDVKERIERTIQNYDTTNCIDKSSAEFFIGYRNTIEIDSIDANLEDLESELKDDMTDLFEEFMDTFVDDFFEKKEEENKEENKEENEEA